MHPFDYSGALNWRTLTFKERIDEGNDVHSFIFTPKAACTWNAGQHALFTLPRKNVKGKKWRAFSVASSAHEGTVRISTIIPPEPSDFKQKLRALTPGEKISMHGPFGEFHFGNGQHIVGIAGGIGITPFRAMMYEITQGHQADVSLHLIYAGKNDFWAFKRECDEWNQHPYINLIYVQTPDQVNAEIDRSVTEFGNERSYFISGSPGMIGAIKGRLQAAGIKKIINDPFKGY